MQIMEAAVSYFDLNDSRYVKLRNKLNLKLIQNGEFDHFYATRHGGQFIFYVRNRILSNYKIWILQSDNSAKCFFKILENGHVEKYLEFLISNRSGAKRVQELRTILLMLDLVKLNSCDLLALTKESVKEKLDDIFMKKHFSSKELEELQKTEGLKLLSKVVDYDDRYLLNLLPDYSKFLKRWVASISDVSLVFFRVWRTLKVQYRQKRKIWTSGLSSSTSVNSSMRVKLKVTSFKTS